jgi:transglutaminase-like putative cysteine protease
VVEEKSNELTLGLSDEIEKATVIFNWVRDKIPHSKDIASNLVTCSATEVLTKGTGVCFAKSHLLAGMLRAQDIPTGFCYQTLIINTEVALHGFNGVYLQSIDKWILIDPRGNSGSCDAQFSIDEEKLAFSMDPLKGEFIYDDIFSEPAKGVANALKKSGNREELGLNMPSSL